MLEKYVGLVAYRAAGKDAQPLTLWAEHWHTVYSYLGERSIFVFVFELGARAGQTDGQEP